MQKQKPSPFLSASLWFGVLVTLLSFALFGLFVAIGWLVLDSSGAWPRTSTGAVDWPFLVSLVMSFGQVYTGFVAIFLAGVLGFLAIREFSEGQEKPSLKLAFHPSLTDTLDLEPVPNTISIAVVNDGAVVGVWYQLELRVPRLSDDLVVEDDGWFAIPTKENPQARGWSILTVAGTVAENWRLASDHERGEPASDHERDEWILAFLSNGAVAVYPGFPLVLCQFQFKLPSAAELRYTVAAEKSRPVSGVLKVLVRDNSTQQGAIRQATDVGVQGEGTV